MYVKHYAPLGAKKQGQGHKSVNSDVIFKFLSYELGIPDINTLPCIVLRYWPEFRPSRMNVS